jgi:hypothetical protein
MPANLTAVLTFTSNNPLNHNQQRKAQTNRINTNQKYLIMNDRPTDEQITKMAQLFKQGYRWDKKMSESTCKVVLKKDDDIWLFGLNGEIIHRPQYMIICLN